MALTGSSVDVAMGAVLSELGDISLLRVEQRTTAMAWHKTVTEVLPLTPIGSLQQKQKNALVNLSPFKSSF